MKRYHIIVDGRVQGVFFRLSTRKLAQRLGLAGFVRNNPDGTVEIVAQGEELKLKELVDFCHKGPFLAKVRSVDVKEEKPGGEYDDFRVVYSYRAL